MLPLISQVRDSFSISEENRETTCGNNLAAADWSWLVHYNYERSLSGVQLHKGRVLSLCWVQGLLCRAVPVKGQELGRIIINGSYSHCPGSASSAKVFL